MIVYTYSEARQNLAALLDRAAEEGEVRIRRKDGQIFVIKPLSHPTSPLEVPSVNLEISTEEIVRIIREGRERP